MELREYQLKAKEDKAKYDREYRAKNRDSLKAKKRTAHKLSYDPIKAKIKRKEGMQKHVEYCRRPEYKANKSIYDRKRNESQYGDFYEAALVLNLLLQEIRKQEPDRSVRYAQAKRFGWSPTTQEKIRRKRAEERAIKNSRTERSEGVDCH